MRIQLIKTPITELPKVDKWYMPLELISLANAVSDVADVEILDGTHLSKEEIIDRIDADVVGITYTSLSTSNIKELAKTAKSKGSYVVFGGQAATANPIDLFRLQETDAVIVNAGEIPLKLLVENGFKKLDEVPNLVYRNEKINRTPQIKDSLENYGVLDRLQGGLNIEDYIAYYDSTTTFPQLNPKRPTNIFSQKGCPRTCSFCARQDKEHQKRDPQKVVQEITILKEKYGIDYLFDVSDTWAKDFHWMKEFADTYCDANKLPMTIFADIRDITPEKLELMRYCGIDHILFGVESGSNDILRINGKPYTNNTIYEKIKATRDVGIKISASFVVGLIGENKESLHETEQIISRITDLGGVHPYINVIIPLPGSRLWRQFTEDSSMKEKYSNSLNYDLTQIREDFLKRHTCLTLSELLDFRDKVNYEAGLEKVLEYAR
ncbi:MAG: B12-binding domain-containing radical SAM protein [Nanoarchaeota archaeon]|nr:B12-binding domain-containing radical SAM protein [Nanoarchaeota archaeon]MBU1269759.1 B12-binding domain-containing radical SAM protein [Nanoarchaeota archaeon]MBU1604351.1 B12-binding domain-containing radical SAM protein [Nanoarchaeota archaeon]MBU2443393.1 B12-binding domain-containing radical SAM protein [Nanoarchaeota archaeon]